MNPATNPTQTGFLKVFAVWIVEDDLPFTTCETGGIRRLFNYMQSKFWLPSGTTVRNTLARIYQDMFDRLKADLKVRTRIITPQILLTLSLQDTAFRRGLNIGRYVLIAVPSDRLSHLATA